MTSPVLRLHTFIAKIHLFGAKDGTQNFLYAGQMLYQLSYIPSPYRSVLTHRVSFQAATPFPHVFIYHWVHQELMLLSTALC